MLETFPGEDIGDHGGVFNCKNSSLPITTSMQLILQGSEVGANVPNMYAGEECM